MLDGRTQIMERRPYVRTLHIARFLSLFLLSFAYFYATGNGMKMRPSLVLTFNLKNDPPLE